MVNSTFRTRLWSKVIIGGENECWEWLAYRNRAGYGVINRCDGTGNALAHRAVYEDLRGSIPKGITIDHLCLNHACVNPAHLEVVTRAENARRGAARVHNNRDKTHCKNGHPFDEENTYAWQMRGGKVMRTCRICNNEAGKRYYKRKKLSRSQQPATPPA